MNGIVVSNRGLLDVPLLFNGVMPGCLFDGSEQQRPFMDMMLKLVETCVPEMSPLR